MVCLLRQAGAQLVVESYMVVGIRRDYVCTMFVCVHVQCQRGYPRVLCYPLQLTANDHDTNFLSIRPFCSALTALKQSISFIVSMCMQSPSLDS